MTHTLVVGGTRGIGRAVTRRFAADGHTVSVLGRRRPEEAELPQVELEVVDLADGDALTAALTRVVERAGPARNAVFLQRFRGDGDSWQEELDVSLTATKLAIDALTGSFPAGSSIVVVGSNASRLIAEEQPVGYHAAKAALTQMVRYYAVRLGPQGIRVNAVTPGSVLKEESAQAYRASPWSGPVEALSPLRRIGTAEDVANAVALLCDERAAYVTGHELVVDGGLSLLWQESVIRLVVDRMQAAQKSGEG